MITNYLQPHETERLYIRPLEMSDIDKWETFIANEKATMFFPDQMKQTPGMAKQWIEMQLERYKNGKYGLLALIEKSTGEFVGQSGLLKQEIEGKEELEVGYSLLPDYWGKGYATEAAQYFKQLGFDKVGVQSIISIIHVDNTDSHKVAERNGMKRTILSKFKEMDVFIYRITEDEYRA